MSLILSGTDGLSDVDGSAATPAIRGTDTNTGIFFPAADTVGMSTGGSERVRVDSSGNVGIGTASNASGGKLEVNGGFISSALSGKYLNFGWSGSNAYIQTTDVSSTGYNLIFYGGASERMRIDSSGNFGVGTSTFNSVRTVIQGSQTGGAPQTSGTAQTYGLLRLQGTTFTSVLDFGTNGGNYNWIQATDSSNLATNYNLAINPNGGNVMMGVTTPLSSGKFSISFDGSTRQGQVLRTTLGTTGSTYIQFENSAGSTAGYIIQNGTTTVNYVTSSDYRLKEAITPMTGALAKVAQLKPVTYKWKVDGSDGEGFIAHELAEVCPIAVTREKDAVDAEGNPQYQGIDTSFLVATLTAAIQEQQALITTLTARITALETP